jgi:DNA-binding LacI/PurR family transcriptional regulator
MKGYPMMVLNSDNSLENESSGLDLLFSLNVKGVIFVSVGDNEDVYHRLRASKIPVVIMDREIPETEVCDFVISDNRQGMIDCVQYLVDLGHQAIGFIKGLQNTDPGRVRYNAYIEGLNQFGLQPDPRIEFDGEFDYWSGLKIAGEIYNLPKTERPSAIISSNDMMAFGLLQGLIRHEIHVPNEVSIIGFDDIPISSWVNPKLTTVRQEITQIAISAAELLVSRIEGLYSGAPRLRYIEPRLIKRETVKLRR